MSSSGVWLQEEAAERFLGVPRPGAEHVRQVALRIEVDGERALPALRDRRQQVERSRRLADAALLVEHCNDGHRPRIAQRALRGEPFASLVRHVASRPKALSYHCRFDLLPLPVRVISNRLQFIVMAAGQGKRMHSQLPKVLHSLAGRPLVAHVLDAARSLSPAALCLVVGHGGDRVRAVLAAPDLAFVTQDPPRGTGDAVKVALAALDDEGVTVVANGDCPLVPAPTFAAIAERAAAGHLALLTARVADPAGLGRILRDANGHVRAIVEERDASTAERAVSEIYTGVLAAPTALLRRWVGALRADNAQREYYLTDIVGMAVAEGIAVEGHLAADERDILGVNDRAQLAAIERIVQTREAETLLRQGTSIADPARIDVRGPLACGRDVRIDVGCVFEGAVTLGDDVTRRRLLRAEERERGRRHADRAVLASRGRRDRAQLPHRPLRAAASGRRAR